MEDAHFWQLIEDTRRQCDGNCEEQAETLKGKLVALPAEEIIAFDRIFREYHARAYRWELWGAAYLMNGGCSDDGFDYFRAWLIGQGHSIYERALETPDSLAEVNGGADGDAECEELLYASAVAYETKTGVEIPYEQAAPAASPSSEPAGERWNDDDLDTLYPALAARYG